MSATVRSDGTVVQRKGVALDLDRLEAKDVNNPHELARALNRIVRALRTVAKLVETPWIDFEDRVFTTGGVHVLAHGFGGRVRFAIVDWSGVGGAHNCQVTASDDDSITITGYVAGTATIRVWRAA